MLMNAQLGRIVVSMLPALTEMDPMFAGVSHPTQEMAKTVPVTSICVIGESISIFYSTRYIQLHIF